MWRGGGEGRGEGEGLRFLLVLLSFSPFRHPLPFTLLVFHPYIFLLVATMNQQAYGKMGMQILINLLKQFPNREFVHDLVATMIANVAANRMTL